MSVILVGGGSRSGKSSYAQNEALVRARADGCQPVYIATARPDGDPETLIATARTRWHAWCRFC